VSMYECVCVGMVENPHTMRVFDQTGTFCVNVYCVWMNVCMYVCIYVCMCV